MISENDEPKKRMFSRRAMVLYTGAFGMFGLLFSRLYQLQVVYADQYRMKATENRIKVRLVPPRRGLIMDRFGVELANNRQNFRVQLIPEDADGREISDILDDIGKVVDISDTQRKRVLQKVRRSPSFVPVMVAENLSWQRFAQINLLGPDLPGVETDVGDTRHYPYGKDLAHVVGYVGAVSREEVGGDPLLRYPGFRIGKNGVERTLDLELRGKAGSRQVEVNAGGKVVRTLGRQDADPGQSTVLTLDMHVQQVATRVLEGESGSAVVMDINTGEIIALVSQPGFDPNDFNIGMSSKKWKSLINDKYNPLLNKSITGEYPPGSTVKPVVALAAMHYGLADPSEQVFCNGKITLGRRDFHCWRKHGHGAMNMHDGIKHSCDVYFYEIARRLGPDRIAEVGHMFGLGEKYDFGLPGERSGLLGTTGWKRATKGDRWHKGDTLNVGIGQGYFLATPLQLAVMTSRLANGGIPIIPRLIRSVGGRKYEGEFVPKPTSINPDHLKVVMDAMNAVTNSPTGTAFQSRIEDEGLSMGGKTGTSQVRRITKEERLRGVFKNEDLPWERRDHALFVGYGPVEAPKYAVAVIVEHGGGGSKAAAPRARDILRETLLRDPSARLATDAVIPAEPPVGTTASADTKRG